MYHVVLELMDQHRENQTELSPLVGVCSLGSASVLISLTFHSILLRVFAPSAQEDGGRALGSRDRWPSACLRLFFSRSFLPPRSLKHARSIRHHCVIAVIYMTRAFALNCKLQMAADCLASPAMLIFQTLKEVCAYQFYPWQKPGQAIVISPLDKRRL